MLTDVKIIEPKVFTDERGYFTETWNKDRYLNYLYPNYNDNFVQDNESCSKKGVFRGFHWQVNPIPQKKLVRVVKGKIIDIVVCLQKDSPDFGKFECFELSGENKKQLFIPEGFAHGFIALEDNTIVNYKVNNYWSKEHERCLNFNEVISNHIDLSEYNIDNLIISDKDRNNSLTFAELKDSDLF